MTEVREGNQEIRVTQYVPSLEVILKEFMTVFGFMGSVFCTSFLRDRLVWMEREADLELLDYL